MPEVLKKSQIKDSSSDVGATKTFAPLTPIKTATPTITPNTSSNGLFKGAGGASYKSGDPAGLTPGGQQLYMGADGNVTTTNPNAPANPQDQALKKLTDTPAPKSPEEIYKEKSSQSQGLVDSVANYFQNMLGGQERINQSNIAESNAENVARGLVGSSGGYENVAKTMSGNQQATNQILAQKQTEMAKILNDIQTRSDQELKDEQNLYYGNQKDTITGASTNAGTELTQANTAEQLRATKEASQATAKGQLGDLSKMGITSQKIKESQPELWQRLLDQTGMNDFQMQSYIDNNPDNPNKPVVKEIPMPSADGKSTVIKRISFDPRTGQSTETDYTINTPFATFSGKGLTTTTEGKVFQQQSDGSYKDITQDISTANTTDQKDYEYAKKQAIAAGKTPPDFDTWVSNKKAPASVKEYNAAVAAGFKGDILEYQQQKKGAGAGSGLDAETLKFYADKYLTDGTTPSFGYGAAGMTARAQFYKEVANTANSQGKTGAEASAIISGNKAAASALTLQQKLLSTTQSSEQSALKNAELAYKYGESYDRPTDLNLANKFQNWVGGQVSDKNLSQFELALFTATREYAKVASGAAGSTAGLTESATKEAEKLLNSAMTQAQLRAAIDAMRADMTNVTSSMEGTITNLKDQVANSGNAGTSNSSGGSSGGSNSSPTPKANNDVAPLF